MQVKHVFLPNYPLVLSPLKLRSFGVPKKKSGPNRESPLNGSIDIGD